MLRLPLTAFVLTALALATGARAQSPEQTFAVRTAGDLAELYGDRAPSHSLLKTAAPNFCGGYLPGAGQRSTAGTLRPPDRAR